MQEPDFEDVGGMPGWMARPLMDAIVRKMDAEMMARQTPADRQGFEPFDYTERS